MPSLHDLWLQVLGVPPASFTKTGNGGPVRPSEIVSGASGVQYSYGENTAETDEDGGDFAEGSRKNATSNNHSKAYSGYKDGSNPMQSPDLGKKGEFSLRYAIGFLCSKYPKGWGNLDDIADYSKPNSKFLKAFSGMAKSQQFTNPTKSQVLAGISGWTNTLAKALPPGGEGELVVTFQGHGAHGSFYATDGNEIKSGEMMGLATQAEKVRVSITYVMDACFSGGAVPDFQDHAADSVDKNIVDNVEGKGQVCSPENDKNANALRDQMAHARELILFSRTVSAHGDKLNGLIQTLQSNETEAAWDAAMAENAAIIKMIGAEKVQFKTNMNFGNDPRMKLGDIAAAFDTVLAYLNGIQPRTCFSYDDWTGAIGKFEDQIGDGANLIIQVIQKQAS